MNQACTQLPPHVFHVVVVRPEPEMAGIHARRIVPVGTIVKYVQAIGDRSVVQYPRRLMRADDPATLAAGADVAVAVSVLLRSSPQPATVSLVDLGPESDLERRPSASCRAVLARRATESSASDQNSTGLLEKLGAAFLADAGHAAWPHGTLSMHRDVPLTWNRGARPGVLPTRPGLSAS